MKNNHFGKAEIWTDAVIRKMRQGLKIPRQRLIFEISLYTGERMGAIVQLKVSDVYDEKGKVLECITFARGTRKASKHGLAATRQIFIHDDLKLHLEQYDTPQNGYLFPSDTSSTGHITHRAVDLYWRSILTKHGIKGFSTHSSRRWVINELRKQGTEISIIAETMAISIATVRAYLDQDPASCKRAIATLTT
jgi:integrase/recombinase XerD